MLGSIQGKLLDKHNATVLVETQGLGYEINVPLTTLCQMPALGEKVFLWLHLVVREDIHQLFGFMQSSERILFRTLLKVSGVGPKLALTILSGMDVEQFIYCIEMANIEQLTGIPGLGKKTAERLIVELKDKLKTQWTKTELDQGQYNSKTGMPSPKEDAVSALISLGYKPQAANQIVGRLKTLNLSRESIIKQALKELTKS